MQHEPQPRSPYRFSWHRRQQDYLKVQTSCEATMGATGFLLMLRGMSGSGEFGLFLGAMFVEGDTD